MMFAKTPFPIIFCSQLAPRRILKFSNVNLILLIQLLIFLINAFQNTVKENYSIYMQHEEIYLNLH